MSYRKCARLVAVVVAGLACSAVRAGDNPPAEACPGAESWKREHQSKAEPAQAGIERNPNISEAALLEDLRARVKKDQSARKRWLADQDDADLAGAVDSIDTENVAWLRRLIADNGFPTVKQVGKEGFNLTWVLLVGAMTTNTSLQRTPERENAKPNCGPLSSTARSDRACT